MIALAGTTWAHARSIGPLAAASQWFADAGADLSITWSTHSARQFGEGPLEPLCESFDLVCFDHPHTGHAAEHRLFLPVDEHLDREALDDLRAASAGASFDSYASGGRQWGLPVDATCSMSAWRRDKLGDRIRVDDSQTFDDLIRFATEHPAIVVQPFSRMTTTAVFLSVSASLSGAAPGRLERRTFGDALERLQRLHRATDGAARRRIGSIEAMRLLLDSRNEAALIPFAYPYACFARADIVGPALRFGPHPRLDGATRWRGMLGGAGLAVSSRSAHPQRAFELLRWLTSPECQTGLILACLGQPADRRAWTPSGIDRASNGFFSAGLALLDAAWLRPTDTGFHAVQSRLADLLLSFLDDRDSIGQARQGIEGLLRPYLID